MSSGAADVLLAVGLTTFLGLFAYLARYWAQSISAALGAIHKDQESIEHKIDGLTAATNRRAERLDRRLTRLESWREMHELTHHTPPANDAPTH